jgi:hydrogenase nickel incorporation protein HypA/HybF
MHEYSIVQALMERVQEEARAHRATAVHRLHVRIGELSGVEADLLATAWEIIRDKTICRETPLQIHAVPARWICSGCGGSIRHGEILRCPTCGQPARLAAGDEIILERIEMEVE